MKVKYHKEANWSQNKNKKTASIAEKREWWSRKKEKTEPLFLCLIVLEDGEPRQSRLAYDT